MSRAPKITLFAIGGVLALLALAAIIVPLFLNADTLRAELEARVAESTGQELHIGTLDFSLLPRLEVAADTVRFGADAAPLVAVERIELGIDVLPLLRREVRIDRIELHEPFITLERYEDGTFNVGATGSGDASLSALDLRNIGIRNGRLVFRDALTASEYQLEACNVDVGNVSLAGDPEGNEEAFAARLSLGAELDCASVRRNSMTLDEVEVAVAGADGVFDLQPRLTLFGARGEGGLRADFSDGTARYELDYRLPGILLDGFIGTLTGRRLLEGRVDLAAQLTLAGNTKDALLRSMNGTISLNGQDLVLYGKDLDEEFKLYETSQTFTLIDMGALLVAGPLGIVATKGYDFGNLFMAEGAESRIRLVISDWSVQDGLATARDVAIATDANRLALKGTLDFPNGTFDDVTFALLDENGCAKVEQKIRGSFQDPEIEKPGVLEALAGPAMSLLEQGAELLGEEEESCEPFYAGSLQPPTAAPE